MKNLKKKEGFTLIELVVVMAIIAVLAVLVIGAITIARRSATEAANSANSRTLQACLEGYFANKKEYCSTAGNVCGAKTVSDGISQINNAGTTCTAGTGTKGDATNVGGGRVTALTSTTYTIEVANYNGESGGTPTKTIDTLQVQ